MKSYKLFARVVELHVTAKQAYRKFRFNYFTRPAVGMKKDAAKNGRNAVTMLWWPLPCIAPVTVRNGQLFSHECP
jgi:hypothetical protein